MGRYLSKRITITGAGGMLGQELLRALAGNTVIGLNHASCDITNRDLAHSRIAESTPDIVIHLAAFTKVNLCQRNPELARAVNDEGSRNVAEAANDRGARFVYISTDYVFDGKKRAPYVEDDPVSPINEYGRSKAAGEQHALHAPGSLVIRCGWLFGAGGRNFVEAIRQQIAAGTPLSVVDDQIGTPIWTRHLAKAIAALVMGEQSGIVHAAAQGECSWHEFACAIVELTGADASVAPVKTEPNSTPRPAYSVLSDRRLSDLGYGPLPHWREGLRAYLADSKLADTKT